MDTSQKRTLLLVKLCGVPDDVIREAYDVSQEDLTEASQGMFTDTLSLMYMGSGSPDRNAAHLYLSFRDLDRSDIEIEDYYGPAHTLVFTHRFVPSLRYLSSLLSDHAAPRNGFERLQDSLAFANRNVSGKPDMYGLADRILTKHLLNYENDGFSLPHAFAETEEDIRERVARGDLRISSEGIDMLWTMIQSLKPADQDVIIDRFGILVGGSRSHNTVYAEPSNPFKAQQDYYSILDTLDEHTLSSTFPVRGW